LTNSISDYIKSLESITGFFNNLCADLTTLKEYFNEVKTNVSEEICKFYHKNINDNVNMILDACKIYLDSEGIISSNLDYINDAPDSVRIDEWI
jgi:hypothetical protein